MSLVDWVRLSLSCSVGSSISERILEKYPNPADFFAEDYETRAQRLLPFALEKYFHDVGEEAAEETIHQMDYIGGDIITKESEDYPELLRTISNPPVVLYVLGDLSFLKKAPAIAIIGTREISDYGKKTTALISTQLAKAGVAIISGMAKGSDTEGHISCLNAGGKTVAVLGCGILNTYPPENAQLKEAIIQNGAVISEFPPNAKASSEKFLLRNRIVSGLSLGVCVIEAAYRSGTSVTAKLAAEQGRKVFAVPGDIFSKNNQGIMRLLRNGAIPVASGADILAEFANEYPREFEAVASLQKESPTYDGEESSPAQKRDYSARRATAPKTFITKEKPPAPAGLSADAVAIYEAMSLNGETAEALAEKTGLSFSATTTALTELELCGVVSPSSGGKFIIS